MGGARGRDQKVMVLLFLCSLIMGEAGCGGEQLSGTTRSAIAGWELSERTVFVEGKPANASVVALLRALAAPGGRGVAVSEQEFREQLARLLPEVYAENVIKYATPQSVAIQNREHADYRTVFMKPRRIKEGVKFLVAHQVILDKAATEFSVASKDIVAILMWESGLGEFVGNHLIFNVLLGQILYLDQARDLAARDLIRRGEADSSLLPVREAEGRRLERLKRSAVANLAALLRISKEKGVDATRQRGSWGGAIGYVQFMPSSLQFARDGDGDGRIDLCTWPDAIFSVANFLHANGYGASEKSRRYALLAYNPIDSYADGVIQYAEAIIKKLPETAH
ncbi:MAG TPA: lytic murein transglycosylase [bacterium]|nr:lytic murein transglycosylase [bacterium]HPR86617.1 lytic murein transglycosylase [bacterium]